MGLINFAEKITTSFHYDLNDRIEWYSQLNCSLIGVNYGNFVNQSSTPVWIYNNYYKADVEQHVKCLRLTQDTKIRSDIDIKDYDVYLKCYKIINKRYTYPTTDAASDYPWVILAADDLGTITVPAGEYGLNGWEILRVNKTNIDKSLLYVMNNTDSLLGNTVAFYDKVNQVTYTQSYPSLHTVADSERLAVLTFPGFYVNNKSFSRLSNVDNTTRGINYYTFDQRIYDNNNILKDGIINLGKIDRDEICVLFNGMDHNYDLQGVQIDRANHIVKVYYDSTSTAYPIEDNTELYLVQRNQANIVHASEMIDPYNSLILYPQEDHLGVNIAHSVDNLILGGTPYESSSSHITPAEIQLNINSPELQGCLLTDGINTISELTFSTVVDEYKNLFVRKQFSEIISVGEQNCKSATSVNSAQVISLQNNYGGSERNYRISDLRAVLNYNIYALKNSIDYRIFTNNKFTTQMVLDGRDKIWSSGSTTNYYDKELINVINTTVNNLPGLLPQYINLLSNIKNAQEHNAGTLNPAEDETWTGLKITKEINKPYTTMRKTIADGTEHGTEIGPIYPVDIYYEHYSSSGLITRDNIWTYRGIRFGFNLNETPSQGYVLFAKYKVK